LRVCIARRRPRAHTQAPQAFDWSAPTAVCNTPTAAAALSSLGRTPATATPAVPRGRPAPARPPAPPPPPRNEQTVEVDCAGFKGRLLLAFPPLQIRVDSGELLGPLEFERTAGCARGAPGGRGTFRPRSSIAD
jgi:hypothetical protein